MRDQPRRPNILSINQSIKEQNIKTTVFKYYIYSLSMFWFQLLQSEILLLSSVLYHYKLNISGIWAMRSLDSFYHFLMFCEINDY